MLHDAGIIHGDLFATNFLIDTKGHLVIADFGLAKRRTDNESSRKDWRQFYSLCYTIFHKLKMDRNENKRSLMNMLKNMTDIQLPGK